MVLTAILTAICDRSHVFAGVHCRTDSLRVRISGQRPTPADASPVTYKQGVSSSSLLAPTTCVDLAQKHSLGRSEDAHSDLGSCCVSCSPRSKVCRSDLESGNETAVYEAAPWVPLAPSPAGSGTAGRRSATARRAAAGEVCLQTKSGASPKAASRSLIWSPLGRWVNRSAASITLGSR